MVTASVARAIKGDFEKDIPSNCSYKDLNLTAAEITSNILFRRENAELQLRSCLSESDEAEELDDCNKSSSKILHPDDYRRRLIPFANIFNKPLPVFLPPPSDDELENIRRNKGEHVGIVGNGGSVGSAGSVEKESVEVKSSGHNDNGNKSIRNGDDTAINNSHDNNHKYDNNNSENSGAGDGVTQVETSSDYPDRRLNAILSQSSPEKKSKANSSVTRYYPKLKWEMKAGVMHVFEVNPIENNRAKPDKDIEVGSVTGEKSEEKQTLTELILPGMSGLEIKEDTPVNLFPVLTFNEFVKDFNYVSTNLFV
jgi:hypothetical protein